MGVCTSLRMVAIIDYHAGNLTSVRLALEAKGEKIACLEARKHLCWYLRGVPYASYAKGEINKAETVKDVERCLRLIREEL